MEINGLSVQFGGLLAVANLSFGVKDNEIVSLIGPNGAGKTTVVNAITGLTKCTKGSITFRGQNINGLKPHQIAKTGLVRTFQNLNSFQNLTVLENVLIGYHLHLGSNFLSEIIRTARTRKLEKQARINAEEILAFLGLISFKDSRVADLPYGQQKMVEVARALAVEPTLLIMDEPAAGMNDTEKKTVGQYIKLLQKEKGIAIFAIEHDMAFVEQISDRVIAIDFGKKIAEGPFSTVVSSNIVVEAYLGRAVTG